jgi:hypothetical protein
MNESLARIALAGTLILGLSGCEQDKPTSYLIPKEERNVTMPVPAADPAKDGLSDTAVASTPGTMQVLPGMQAAADEAGEIAYTVPAGWEEIPPSGIRKANLKVADENGSAELTVLVFPGDVGGNLANINRWRGQVALEPITADKLPEITENYTIAAHSGLYVRLEGGAQSILGALLPFHGSTWFFKFQGDSGTILANEGPFKAYLDSVQMVDHQH